MKGSYSLRRRLVAVLLVALLAIAGLATADSWREAHETATNVSDRVLVGSILAIAERVVVTDDGSLEVDVPYVALEMLTSTAQDRVFYRVDGPDGFITGYQNLPTVPQSDDEVAYADAEFRGEAIRVGSLRRAASSGVSAIPYIVTVAETTIARTQLSQSLLVRATFRLVLLILAAAVIVWVAVTLSLAPLYRLQSAIAARSSDDLSAIQYDVPREVQGLVVTINSFMARLSTALEALRHFTGNASHQLRTPMAIVRTQLVLAQRADTDAERMGALRVADEAVSNAERILAQLLLLARIDKAASDLLRREEVDLVALARSQTSDHVLRAHAAGIDLGFEGEGTVKVHGDAMLLGEMLRNLIENAIAYAGPGSEATVRVNAAEASAVLVVSDTGGGIPSESVPRLLHRFDRLHPDKPGAGLGLSIVQEIGSLFGGTLDIQSAAGAGFKVTVRFPLSTHPPAERDGTLKSP